MNGKIILSKFIKFSGLLEIVIGTFFFLLDTVNKYFGIVSEPFFILFGAVTLIFFGFLLFFSGRDLERYAIIPVCSCIYRYCMVFGPLLYGILMLPAYSLIILTGAIYDLVASTYILVSLKKYQYFAQLSKM